MNHVLLYIEDDDNNVSLVEALLKRRPQIEPQVAMNGRDGVQAAIDKQPALILPDNRLPDATGRYGPEELAGQLVEVLVPDAIKAGHPARRAEYLTDPRPRTMGTGIELAGRRRDGSTFPAEIALSAIATREGTLVSAAIRDVSERRELLADRDRLKAKAERDRRERQHERARQLESLGQLAGAIAVDHLLGHPGANLRAAPTAPHVPRRRQGPQGDPGEPVERDELLVAGQLPQAHGLEPLLIRTVGEHVQLATR